jgi:hypothetical protein
MARRWADGPLALVVLVLVVVLKLALALASVVADDCSYMNRR